MSTTTTAPAPAADTRGATGHPVITAWSAVSPFGIGRDAFRAGLRERRRTADRPEPVGPESPESPESPAGPDGRACTVPSFDVRAALGRKGTRSMDRVTGLAVTTVGALLDDTERNRAVGTGEGAALALGTTTGSAQSMMDFTRDSLTGEQPFFVDPARFPNTVMNCAAGQSAIWYQLKGPNTTIAGGRTAGLHALNYSRRLLAAGRAQTVLCGAAEEYSTARAWLEHHSGAGVAAGGAPLGEGCAMLLVEPSAAPGAAAGQPVLAEVLAVELGVVIGDDVRTALTACLERAFRRAGVAADQVAVVARCEAPGAEGAGESAAVAALLDGVHATDLELTELVGDTGAASAGLQVAGLLAWAEDNPPETNPSEANPPEAARVGLVTSVDRSGGVGCALLRLR
ncbi:3-oxoacyl-ACP synthase [Streptomyces sp. OF3]|uniref:3-oxoacyl-ACP synthase n=1 Tax=Streptomyces alkaliterrae TaxID=2213162 RepID=A0A7W3ZLG2_9ACTN|nr:beta-ketoacyl synthase N-terminal-like domain-containing protein [Streptomyces alkaliterrae]MBB1252748.1 3-oxoacyl-ACP synthase [Streptomyces alkaliterrae]